MKHFLIVLILGLGLAGCTRSGKSDAKGAKLPPAGSTPELKRRDIASLPPVGDYLPPLDNDRLQIAPPADWNVVRNPKWLVAFAKGKTSELPRIVVTVEDVLAGMPTSLTEE